MCKHLNTRLEHKVVRLTETGKPDTYRLELKLRCTDCSAPFNFITPQMGFLNDQPTTDPKRLELRIPIIPDITVNN